MKIFDKKSFSIVVISIGLLGATIPATSFALQNKQESVDQYIDATAIKSKILAEEDLKNTDISVKTFKGVVQLSGFVHTNLQKLQAEQIALSVEGVNDVNNSIVVKQ